MLGSGLHNFADDNTVTAVAETIQDLINSLEVKTSDIIEWMKDNDMIANPNKFKAIVLTKTDHNSDIFIYIRSKAIDRTNDADLIACMQAEVMSTWVQKLPQLRPLAEIT